MRDEVLILKGRLKLIIIVLSDGSKIIFSYSRQIMYLGHFYKALKKELFHPDELCCQYLLECLNIWALKKEYLHPDWLCCQYPFECLNIWTLGVQCLQWADINYHSFDKSSLYRYFFKCSLKQQSALGAGYHWFFLITLQLLIDSLLLGLPQKSIFSKAAKGQKCHELFLPAYIRSRLAEDSCNCCLVKLQEI